MRTRPSLLEREEALGRLGEAVASAAEGAGRVVVVAGEAGVGKTTLVRRFVEEAGGELRVTWGACDDLTVPDPLAPLRDIAEQTGDPLAAALRSGDLRKIGRALREELAGVTPTLCVIEDAIGLTRRPSTPSPMSGDASAGQGPCCWSRSGTTS